MRAQGEIVRAVLFYAPTCPHCHEVINEDLPDIFAAYGGDPRVSINEDVPQFDRSLYYVSNGRLEILLVDASRPFGSRLYRAATEQFGISPERSGVPRLIVGDSVLVGSYEIPMQLPTIIEAALASGGLDWPAIEGLEERIPPTPVPQAAAPEGETEESPLEEPPWSADTTRSEDTTAVAIEATPAALESIPFAGTSVIDRLRRDPVGNTLAIGVLAGMIISVAAVILWSPQPVGHALRFAVPVVSSIGILVAAYLSYVELTGAVAVCGPVGDCNTVQQSSYARLFDIVPVGVVGLLGYLAIIAAWIVERVAEGRTADWAAFALLLMTYVGTCFSIYLTYVEPFVLGASCAWCLTSAVMITLLLWLTAGCGLRAWGRIRTGAR